jgi:transposase-like protein
VSGIVDRDAQMRQLLRSGLTNTQIAQRLHVRRSTVAALRKVMGVEAHRRTVEDGYWARTRPVEGGHLLWTGLRNQYGVPLVPHADRRYSALRVAFRVHYGREPEGIVLAVCDVPRCVAGRCLDDEAARRRTRAQLAAVVGMDHSRERCPQGHLYAETVMYRSNGERECKVCCSRRATPKEMAA